MARSIFKLFMTVFSILVTSIGVAVAQDDDDGAIGDLTHVYDFQLMDGMNTRLKPHGDNLMGDSIDPKTGAITFNHTDVTLPGNSKLDVSLRRRISQGPHPYSAFQQGFADWDIDIPIAYGKYGVQEHQHRPPVANGGCIISKGAMESTTFTRNGVEVDFPDHGEGVVLHVPGIGLSGFPNRHNRISDPKNNWISLPQSTDFAGRCATITKAPNGTKYKFGRHAIRSAPVATIPSEFRGIESSTALRRNYFVYLITEVEDIHGNWVRYDYTNSSRAELTRIYSNDGREIRLNYRAEILHSFYDNSRRVESVIANGRTWTYTYTGTALGTTYQLGKLKKVTLPDSRYWDFGVNTTPMGAMTSVPRMGYKCLPSFATLRLKHPDGAIGTFGIRETRHLKTSAGKRFNDFSMAPMDVPHATTHIQGCNTVIGPFRRPPGLPFYQAMSVISKSISSPNIPTATWTFDYHDYSGGQIDTTWSRETDPIGTQTTRTYRASRDLTFLTYSTMGAGHGLLERVDIVPVSGEGETIKYEYDLLNHNFAGAYACLASSSESAPLGACEAFNYRPVTKVVRTRNSAVYTTETVFNKDNQAFTDFGHPNTIKKYSSISGSTEPRATEINYEHDETNWIIGLPKTVIRNGTEIRDNSYNSKGQLIQQKRFGDDYERYNYHADGNTHEVTDALNRTYKLENYHRGRPRKITRPDGNEIHATFDPNGWLTSVTNARGYKTDYSYNNAGWLTKIEPPAPWVDTNISYSNIGSGTVQRTTSGPRRTTITHDNMHRPILTRTQSLSGGGRNSYVKTRYDSLGRSIFTSRLSTTSNPTNGTETTYDGLGRVIQTRETVAPFATTTTEYLSGNRVRVTDAKGNVTTTTRSGYGSPNDGNVTLIEQPEDINTEMTYDLFGNLLTAHQYGASGGYNVNQTQHWVYDDELRLCRHHTPETGSTLYGYDAVDNITATYKGQPFASNCNLPSNTDRIISEYDELNRVEEVEYIGADNRSDGNFRYRYDGNSNLRSISKYGLGKSFGNYYSYDSADNLIRESIGSEDLTGTQLASDEDGNPTEEDDYFGLSATYTYDANGYLTAMRTPLGRNISYTNNGLGQVTHVSAGGVYYDDTTLTASADNAVYNVDGSLARIRYGNNRTTQYFQNSRQLLSRLLINGNGRDTVIDRDYSYDSLGRITQDRDAINAAEIRRYTYDGVSRLKTASGPWGEGSYQYDALGNIRDKRLGTRRVRMHYNGFNQLAAILDTAGPGNGIWQRVTSDNYGNVTDNGRRRYSNTSIVLDPSRVEIGYTGAFPLPRFMNGDVTASYSYDGNYRRAYQKIDGEETLTFYSQSGAILMRATLDPNVSRDLSLDINRPVVYTDYIRAGGKTIARVSRRAGDETEEVTYMHQNHLGSPIATTDVDGNVLWRESYTPFGEKWLSDGDNDDNVGFTGHIHDSKSNLTYMQARYYDPTIGRFLSIDPVTFMDADYDPRMFNRYSYVFNDPINGADSTGMICDTGICGEIRNFIRNEIFPGPDNAQELVEKFGQPVSDIGQTMSDGTQSISGVEMDVVMGLTSALGNGAGRGPTGATNSTSSGGAMRPASTETGLPKVGSAGGPGAGKNFSAATQDAARAASGDRCVFCGTKTVRSPSPASNRSNIDHAIPKSRGGNNTLGNAQNTCQRCNLKKGTKTTEEFLNR